MAKKLSDAFEGHLPTVTLSPRGAARLKSGHPWVYRSDIGVPEGVAPGAMVRVTDQRGKFLGTALYSSSSQIAIRMISREEVTDLPFLIGERIRAAIAYRKQVVANTDAYRVVFSEADFLPGLIVDRYNDVLCIQILTQAMDAEPVRGAVIATLVEEFKPAGIAERVDPRIRELEQLPPRQSGLLWGKKSSTIVTINGTSPVEGTCLDPESRGRVERASSLAAVSGVEERASLPTSSFTIGTHYKAEDTPGIRFHYDALEGQKTGAFLDQRENYAAAARYAHGQALDVFCYQGGFALHLAAKCPTVTGVDSSRPALEMADKNAALNGQLLNGKEIEWIEANAFDLLRDYAAAGRRYDTVVLDPPAFAKTRRDLDKARSGYKELNLRALKMLDPGGVFVTCSCSFHVSAADFLDVVAEAARDAHKSLRLLEIRTQARDHPILLNVPETSYLKCLIFQAAN
jgi:23S rRNA (cytosine1962-C5)-methyltransferase